MPSMQKSPMRPARSGRLRRFLGSGRSTHEIISGLVEEGFVRAMDLEPLRHAYAALRRQPKPGRFIFLVGCYNSGTTLLHRIVASHPDVAAPPREGVRFTRHLSNLELNGHHMVWDESWRDVAVPAAGESALIASEVWRDWSIFHRAGTVAFMDKSVANTARMVWLETYFPEASFIGLHRNGYCIAEGLHRRSRPPAWLKARTGSDHYPLEMAGQQWIDANEAMLDGLALVSRGLKLSFEDLVADPVMAVRTSFEFLRLRPLPVSRQGSSLVVGERSFDIRNPNPASLARLGEEGLAALRSQLTPMMRRLGYEP